LLPVPASDREDAHFQPRASFARLGAPVADDMRAAPLEILVAPTVAPGPSVAESRGGLTLFVKLLVSVVDDMRVGPQALGV